MASRRHPAQVTADRLGNAVDRWGSLFDAQELDMIGQIIDALDEIAAGRREPEGGETP